MDCRTCSSLYHADSVIYVLCLGRKVHIQFRKYDSPFFGQMSSATNLICCQKRYKCTVCVGSSNIFVDFNPVYLYEMPHYLIQIS